MKKNTRTPVAFTSQSRVMQLYTHTHT